MRCRKWYNQYSYQRIKEYQMSGFLDSISGSISEAPYIIKCLTVFLLSMIPVTELRLALPFGIVIGLDYPSAMLFSFLGNVAVIPPVVVWGGKLIRYFAKFEKLGKPFRWILSLGEKKVAKMTKTLFFGLWAFVAIPLPGTGAWTGCLVSITLSKKLREVWKPLVLGVLTAMAVVGAITFLVQQGVTWLKIFI